jgi:hypothetical protein
MVVATFFLLKIPAISADLSMAEKSGDTGTER